MQQWENDQVEVIVLDGEWSFTLGGESGVIHVPGTWEAQGYPRRVEGPAVYTRHVYVPPEWAGRRIQIQFDAVSYHAEVLVNGAVVGEHAGLWTPFAFDVTGAVQPDADNEIRVTVYKPGEKFPIRESLAGFLPDVMLPFGGLWQPARLVAFESAALSDLLILCDADSGDLTVRAAVHGAEGLSASVHVYEPDGSTLIYPAQIERGEVHASFTVPDFVRWSPEQPNLYTAEIHLNSGETRRACASRSFGFRALTADGEQLLFNGEPVCLRGVLNWGWYPDILCPAPDDEAIRDEFRRVRALGFNMVKLCLYVPSPRYFEIADEEGMRLWLELPMWLPHVTEAFRQNAPLEYAAIFSAVHHHPSIVIYSLGCELNQSVDADLMVGLDGIARSMTQGVMICDNSGSGEAYGGLFDFGDFNDYHFYADAQYFDPLVDHFSRDWRPPRPWIFGEFNDADDYRDLDEIEAAFGALPWWLTERNPLHPTSFIAYPEQRERMARVDIGLTQQEIMRISRQQSFVVRKLILEKARARAGMGGYVVTSIRDTPLATSSLFDDLGRAKYDADAFRAFNADSVLLLGRGRARTWTRGGDRPAPFDPFCFAAGQPVYLDIILSHAGKPLTGGQLIWYVALGGDTLSQGVEDISGELDLHGRPVSIARIAFSSRVANTAVQLQLHALLEIGGQTIHNTWPLWIFPRVDRWPDSVGLIDPTGSLVGLDDLREAAKILSKPSDDVTVLLTSTLDENILGYIRDGGKVILLQSSAAPLPALGVPFWREGIKIICDHPIMNTFPHQGYVDAQFYGLAGDWAFDTEKLADMLPGLVGVRPLLRRLDARQFTVSDYLLEVQIGSGQLIASTLRLWGGSGDQPAGLRHHPVGRWLLRQILV